MRYEVWSQFRWGEWQRLYRGDNYTKAVEKTNFWDERQDTWLLDTPRMSFSEAQVWANIRFDNAIARLERAKELKPVTKSYVDSLGEIPLPYQYRAKW